MFNLRSIFMVTAAILLAAVLLLLSGSAVHAAKNVITMKGSDTMVILAQRWAEIYMDNHPDITLQVTGGGSGTGIAALINGTTDICNASRPMKDSEKKKLRDRFYTTGVEISVAKDGIAIYLNASNPVAELSLQQLRDIFTGRITNWKDIGGENAKIILYSRESNSGTYVFFKDNVLKGEDYHAGAQTLPGTAAIVNAISRDMHGIGYGGVAYAKGVKFCRVKKDASSQGYEPNLETVSSGNYPISRDLYFYLRNKPSGIIKNFVDWALSPEGQKIVTEVGYFPVH
ncbi:MAG: phosphate ABC transporter substrate-binding protein [Acidobacteriota bacterium]